MKVVLEIDSNNIKSFEKARRIIAHLENDLELSNSKFERDFDSWIELFLNPKHEVPRYNKNVSWKETFESFKNRFPLEKYSGNDFRRKVKSWVLDKGFKINTSSREVFIVQQ